VDFQQFAEMRPFATGTTLALHRVTNSQEDSAMSIAGIGTNVLASVATALTTPNAATVAVTPPTTQPNGSTQPNNPTGSTNPFQSLSADMQSWLTQNQAAGDTQSPTQTQPHHHHHHGGGDEQQQAGDADATSNTDPTATTPSATA
jgi:hypothetical protein